MASNTGKNKKVNENNSDKKHYLVVGKPVAMTAKKEGYTLSYSDRGTFREIVTDFARYIDKSSEKRKATLFADIISQLDTKNDKMVYGLMEEMFGYKIEMISEINSVYAGVDFLKALKMRVDDNNPPLPF